MSKILCAMHGMSTWRTYATLPVIPAELIDQIVKGPISADAVNAASKAFKKALIELWLQHRIDVLRNWR